jgi:hypothetical protein
MNSPGGMRFGVLIPKLAPAVKDNRGIQKPRKTDRTVRGSTG